MNAARFPVPAQGPILALLALAALAGIWVWRSRKGNWQAQRNATLLCFLLFMGAFTQLAGTDEPALWFELVGVGLLLWTAQLYKAYERRQAGLGSGKAGQGHPGAKRRPARAQAPEEAAGASAGTHEPRPEPPPSPPAKSTEPERGSRAWSLEQLGVSEGALAGEVNAAYRRLMRNVHPDKGGDTSFAQDLNLARKVLLG